MKVRIEVWDLPYNLYVYDIFCCIIQFSKEKRPAPKDKDLKHIRYMYHAMYKGRSDFFSKMYDMEHSLKYNKRSIALTSTIKVLLYI